MKRSTMFKKATLGATGDQRELGKQMSDLLSHADPNERLKQGQKLQQLRLELQEEADSYNSIYNDYVDACNAFAKQFSDESFEGLHLPPAPVLTVPTVEPKQIRPSEAERQPPSFLSRLRDPGFDITKHGRKGKPHKRRLWLTSDGEKLCTSDSSGMGKTVLTLVEAVEGEVVKGWQTEVFSRSKQVRR